MQKRPGAPSCDWKAGKTEEAKAARTKGSFAVHKTPRTRHMRYMGNFSWSGVRTERYKAEDGTWSGVLRKTLAGNRGEKTGFHLRYFEVAPGGRTSFEHHRHEHVVICIRGKGVCLVRDSAYEMGTLDTMYIPPDAPHMFSNPYDGPFGFLCIVDAERDRPRPVTQKTGRK